MKKTAYFLSVPRWIWRKLRATFPLRPDLRRAVWQSGLIFQNEEHFRFRVRPQYFPSELLAAAIRAGNFQVLRQFVQLGIDPLTCKTEFEESPLFVAAEAGRAEMVQYFLDLGASPDDSDMLHVTALHQAVNSGSFETVRALVRAGANLRDTDQLFYTTPLGYAVINDDLEMIQLLLDLMAAQDAEEAQKDDFDEEECEEEGDYLALAVESGSIKAFDFFYAREQCIDGPMLLHRAVCSGSFKMLLHLLEIDGLKLRRKPEEFSSFSDNVPVVRDLLREEAGEQKNEFFSDEDRPFDEEEEIGELFRDALKSGSECIFRYLQSKAFERRYGRPVSFDPKIPGVVYAVLRGRNPSLLRWLLEQGADPNERFGHSTPLSALSGFNPVILARILLGFGADPNLPNDSGETPLTCACSLHSPRSYSLVRLLLKKGANVNGENSEGETPLLAAIHARGSFRLVRLLVESGADLEVCDAEGQSVLELAEKKGNPKLLRYLRYQISLKKKNKNE